MQKKLKRTPPKPVVGKDKASRLVREIVDAHLQQVVGGNGLKKEGTHPCWCRG